VLLRDGSSACPDCIASPHLFVLGNWGGKRFSLAVVCGVDVKGSLPQSAQHPLTEQNGRMSYENRHDNFWKYAPGGMRICTVLMLVTLIPSTLNYYLSLGWLGSYDRLAFGASAIFGLILAHRIHFWYAEGR
jgi:hypothetical protein